MSLAALFGGLALANARLGAVHGFAAVLGGMYTAPHGAICARLLPFVVEQNLSALHDREPAHPALNRYQIVAEILLDRRGTAAEAVDWLRALIRELEIPPLRAYGVDPADFGLIVEKAGKSSSMQGNAIRLTPGEMTAILEKAL
jgi:alcohol dehydrogenase class IV